MTIATCASIKNKGCIDLLDIRHQFEKWLFNKEYTPYGEVFDCGNTCYDAIKNGYGKDDEWSNGNGSLMRIIPLAFINNITDEDIMNVSAITHSHKVSKNICIKYVNIAKKLLEGKEIKETIADCVTNEFIKYLLNCKEDNIKSGGYVVDSFNSSLWCLLNTKNYKECVLKAVNLGGDTDTTAAIAGGLAGIVYGYNSIPNEWIEKLKRKDMIEKYLF